MSQSIEIEYKSFLTKKEYLQLVQKFERQPEDFFTQHNVYFDNDAHQLKKNGLGLRIRLGEQQAEVTLKSPLKKGLLETTEELTLADAHSLVKKNKIVLHGPVAEKLAEWNIPPQSVHIIGELKTKRTEIHLDEEHLLVLDESWYHGQHDYELEMEVARADEGKEYFLKFLHNNQLSYRPSPNKIQRTITAKNAQ